MKFLIDSGARVTLVSYESIRDLDLPINQTSTLPTSLTGHAIGIKGVLSPKVKRGRDTLATDQSVDSPKLSNLMSTVW